MCGIIYPLAFRLANRIIYLSAFNAGPSTGQERRQGMAKSSYLDKNHGYLIPTGQEAETVLDRVLDALGRSGVGLQEMLDSDAAALSGREMQYFPAEMWGQVPSYGVFVKYLNRLPGDLRDTFMETVSEIEAGRYERRMDGLANGFSGDRTERGQFEMYNKLHGIQERRLARIDKRRHERGEGEARGIDLAARMIAALSSAELVRAIKEGETARAGTPTIEAGTPTIEAEATVVSEPEPSPTPELLKDAGPVDLK